MWDCFVIHGCLLVNGVEHGIWGTGGWSVGNANFISRKYWIYESLKAEEYVEL